MNDLSPSFNTRGVVICRIVETARYLSAIEREPPGYNCSDDQISVTDPVHRARFGGGIDWHAIHARGMVCGAEQAVMDASKLGVPGGLDNLVSNDCHSRLAGVACGRYRTSSDDLGRRIGAQRAVVVSDVRSSRYRIGACRYRAALAGNCSFYFRILGSEPDRGVSFYTLFGLGLIRRRP